MNVTSFLLSAFVTFSPFNAADETERRVVTAFLSASQNQLRARVSAFDFNGTYRLDARRGDKLYSVFSSAAAKLPTREERQRVFDDLSVRLSSPDQLAIERRGEIFLIASSRAAQTRIDTSRSSQVAGTRATFSDNKLEVTTRGKDGNSDRFYVAFELIDDGNALRVTRRITAEGISEPIVVTSVYERIAEVARWSIFVEGNRPRATQPDAARSVSVSSATNNAGAATIDSANNSLPPQARVLHNRLDALMAATNANDIEKQSAYYAPRLTRYYLASDVTREAVRAELVRVFKDADLIDIRAADPEIIFTPDGQNAVMRFRKQYRLRKRGALRQGEVVQELRWRLIDGTWKIISERDIQVIRR